ncbi:MAG TPA: ubiquinol-cytochrome c reductase iron-sulfur subunit [Stellaceae bacterium]|nr:ubiquinol-cytochrome c reductase iron-sulfur subunit [Stellaceae bacterium]
MADTAQPKPMDAHTHDSATRRDFLTIAASAITGIGAAVAVWPLIDSMNPAKDTLALSTTEVDLAPVQQGQRLTVKWRGKPVFVDHRSQADIDAANKVDIETLKDPQTDAQRVKKPEWLIIVGVCTHLGCIPLGQKPTDDRGEFGGWFCPCHGSQYDTSGRIRKGPAPLNLEVPSYEFVTDTTVKIG